MNPEASTSSLMFSLVGLPLWLVLPLAVAAAWAIGRLLRREIAGQPERTRRGLTWLRRGAVVLVILLLLEPTLTWVSSESELPAVAVLVDRSGSMGSTDQQMSAQHRLDEAVALGLIEPGLRPVAGHRAAAMLAAFGDDVPALSRALAAFREARMGGAPATGLADAARLAERHAASALGMSGVVGGMDAMAEHFAQLDAGLQRVARLLATDPKGAATGPAGEQPDALIAELNALGERSRELRQRARAAQEASDTALVAGAEAGSPVASGLERLAALSRYERASRLVEGTVRPAFAGRADLHVLLLDDPPVAQPADGPARAQPAGLTDFALPLSRVAEQWAAKHLGAVVVVSDGRQTAGADPLPVIKALNARGALLATVMVGDPQQPRDAVVAELSGAAEVFRGETVRLEARFRITGYEGQDWDLVLVQDGNEVARRRVRGDGQWQTERFDVPGEASGVHGFQARIEPSRAAGDVPAQARPAGGILRETWSGIPGILVKDLLEHPSFTRPAEASAVVDTAAYNDGRANYGGRLRGYVVPPISGEYTFWINGDDESELWLARGTDPAAKARIAAVPGYADVTEWDKFAAQRSQPVVLEAGKAYYLEALHKQGSGGGHLQVGWQMPNNAIERPIPGSRLAPWKDGALPLDALKAAGAYASEASLANNQAEFTVVVNEDPLRVLVVDATPRWGTRFLVSLFERDKRVEVVRRYRSVRLARDQSELLPATQRELDAFDVVIVGDLKAGELSPDDQARLADYVQRRGGFLACIAGPRGMPSGYSLGSLAAALPIRAGQAGTAPSAPLTVSLPRAAEAAGGAPDDSPITAVLDDPTLNRRLWPALPGLEWVATGVTVKHNAQVLLEANDSAHTPVVATCRYGAGRVLWVGSDETWRWRDRLGDRVHQTFWLQAMRWGLGTRLRGKDPRLQVAVDRSLLEPGDAADLRVRATLADGSAIEDAPLARLARLDANGEPLPETASDLALLGVPGASLWNVQLKDLPEGRWRLTVTSGHAQLAGLSEVRDLVVRRRQGVEALELGADRAHLDRLSKAGGWRGADLMSSAAMLAELAERLQPKAHEMTRTFSLWENYLALLAVLALLSVEWAWRKRRGLP